MTSMHGLGLASTVFVKCAVKRVLSSLNYVTLLKQLFKAYNYVLYYTERLAFRKLVMI